MTKRIAIGLYVLFVVVVFIAIAWNNWGTDDRLLVDATPVAGCPRVGPNPCATTNCYRINPRSIA